MIQFAEIQVTNNGKGDIVVFIEPWADSFVLLVGESSKIQATSDTGVPWFNVIYSDCGLQVYVENADSFSTPATLL